MLSIIPMIDFLIFSLPNQSFSCFNVSSIMLQTSDRLIRPSNSGSDATRLTVIRLSWSVSMGLDASSRSLVINTPPTLGYSFRPIGRSFPSLAGNTMTARLVNISGLLSEEINCVFDLRVFKAINILVKNLFLTFAHSERHTTTRYQNQG